MTVEEQGGPVAYTGVVSHLSVSDAKAAIDFYERVFDAEVLWRNDGPDGRLWFAELSIQGGRVFLSDEFPEFTGLVAPTTIGGASIALTVYVDDVDEIVKRAEEAGAEVPRGVKYKHWGDRYAGMYDPFGHRWSIASRVAHFDPDELKDKEEDFFLRHPEYTPERAKEQAELWRAENPQAAGTPGRSHTES